MTRIAGLRKPRKYSGEAERVASSLLTCLSWKHTYTVCCAPVHEDCAVRAGGCAFHDRAAGYFYLGTDRNRDLYVASRAVEYWLLHMGQWLAKLGQKDALPSLHIWTSRMCGSHNAVNNTEHTARYSGLAPCREVSFCICAVKENR